LEKALRQAVSLLGRGGRLVVISYHSLEDRIAKRFMQAESRDCLCPPGTPQCICGHTSNLRLINRKVITPSQSEIKTNPRSRSARMRAAERIVNQEDLRQVAEKMFFLDGSAVWNWQKPVFLRQALRTCSPL
jgi:16S rRNA (cytosine1402-N4)-methyltransferase